MEKITIEDFKLLLAKRIKDRRKELTLTQTQLAIKIGFKDKQVVNNYEINGANPTAYNLVLIARALDLSVDELLDFSEFGDKLEISVKLTTLFRFKLTTYSAGN